MDSYISQLIKYLYAFFKLNSLDSLGVFSYLERRIMLPKLIEMIWQGTFRKQNGVYIVKLKTFTGVNEAECRESAKLFIERCEADGWVFQQGGFDGDYKDTIRRK